MVEKQRTLEALDQVGGELPVDLLVTTFATEQLLALLAELELVRRHNGTVLLTDAGAAELCRLEGDAAYREYGGNQHTERSEA